MNIVLLGWEGEKFNRISKVRILNEDFEEVESKRYIILGITIKRKLFDERQRDKESE